MAGLPEGRVRFVEETGSTNADVLSLAEAGAPEWTTVVAAHQTSGRGRLGRSWASAPGASLLVSVLLRPPEDPRLAPLISLAAGVSTVMACALAGRVEARCKWPNDVVSRGRKLAGILAEARASGARMTHVVVGLGLNVTQRPEDLPEDLRHTATSVATEGGVADHALLLAEYLGMLRLHARVEDAEVRGSVMELYRRSSETIGRPVRATTTAGDTVEGVAKDVGELGELLVETAVGVRAVAFGEVTSLR